MGVNFWFSSKNLVEIMPDKIIDILNNRKKICFMCSVVKGYKVGFFVIAFLVVCSLLLEVILFMPDLAARSSLKLF